MDAESESSSIEPAPPETSSGPTPIDTPAPIDDLQRRHDLRLEAFQLGIKMTPDRSERIPLDTLEKLVVRRREKRDAGLQILKLGAVAQSEAALRHAALMRADAAGVPLSPEESDELPVPEIERRIAAHLSGQKK
jgi:hypothetical protein